MMRTNAEIMRQVKTIRRLTIGEAGQIAFLITKEELANLSLELGSACYRVAGIRVIAPSEEPRPRTPAGWRPTNYHACSIKDCTNMGRVMGQGYPHLCAEHEKRSNHENPNGRTMGSARHDARRHPQGQGGALRTPAEGEEKKGKKMSELKPCPCGSWAVNDDPDRRLCDVCLQKAKVNTLRSELDAARETIREVMEEMDEIIASGSQRIASRWRVHRWRDILDAIGKGER